MLTVNDVQIYEESDFLHLPEDERPHKKHFANRPTEPLVWVEGPKFGDSYPSSLRHEERNPAALADAIKNGKASKDPCNICHKPHYQLS
jgi:hypothetical protein